MNLKTRLLALIFSLLTLVGFGQTKILYYVDLTYGTDRMGEAIAGLGAGYTLTTATDPTDFQTKIATNTYDIGIYFNQADSYTLAGIAAINALGDFMNGGGRVIYSDWSRDATLSPQFGATFTGNNNNTSVTVSDACLAVGLTNPLTLTNPGIGYPVFSEGLSPSGSSTVLATFGNGEAAVVKNDNGRALVIGFNCDTPSATDGVTFFQNAIRCLLGLDTCTPQYTSGPTVSVAGNFCAGSFIGINFGVSSCLTGPFSAYLSDAAGNFPAGGRLLGGVGPGSTLVGLPADVPAGAGYRVRIVSSSLTSSASPAFSVRGLASNFNSSPVVNNVGRLGACAGTRIRLSFTTRSNPCPFSNGTVFTAQLSDASGSFATPSGLGVVAVGINDVTIPETAPTGTGYRVRIAATVDGLSVYSSPSAAFAISQPLFTSVPTLTGSNLCPGTGLRLSFTVGCPYFTGNTFLAQLSNASGLFSPAVDLRVVVPGINTIIIPLRTPEGTGYRIRIVSTQPEGISALTAAFAVLGNGCGINRMAAPDPEHPEGLRVEVSPNPSPEGRLRIRISGADGQALQVALFSGTGQRVREQGIGRASEEETLEWDLSRQPQGLYLIRVSGEKESRTVKVVH